MAVAGDVDWIGADDVLKQFGIGADVERFLLELERPAGFRTIDEEPRRVPASSQEHRGKAGPVAVERRPAPADEEFPRTVVDIVKAGRFGLLVHQRHVAERLLTVSGGPRLHEPDEEGEHAKDDPHHGASMTSERRKATTLSRPAGSSLR